MFGRKPKLPVGSMFERAVEKTASKTRIEYIEYLKARMAKTREIVEEHTTKAKRQQKKNYDARAKSAKIEVGDQVLVRTLAFEGKHKIADRFDTQMYMVDEQVGGLPVYKVRGMSTGNVRLCTEITCSWSSTRRKPVIHKVIQMKPQRKIQRMIR